MAGPHTARARARAAMLDDIRRVALQQLDVEGSAGLSLRAVARELDVVPSALYRYFANRDDLVTALVIDGFDDLAGAVRAAGERTRRTRFATRWVRGGQAVRTWAQARPAHFRLLYAAPVPGYVAPVETVGPATAVVLAVLAPVADAVGAGAVEPAGASGPAGPFRRQLEAVARGLELDIPPALLARAVAAWSETIGLVVLELGGHFVGGFEPADRLVDAALVDQAERLGLRD